METHSLHFVSQGNTVRCIRGRGLKEACWGASRLANYTPVQTLPMLQAIWGRDSPIPQFSAAEIVGNFPASNLTGSIWIGMQEDWISRHGGLLSQHLQLSKDIVHRDTGRYLPP